MAMYRVTIERMRDDAYEAGDTTGDVVVEATGEFDLMVLLVALAVASSS